MCFQLYLKNWRPNRRGVEHLQSSERQSHNFEGPVLRLPRGACSYSRMQARTTIVNCTAAAAADAIDTPVQSHFVACSYNKFVQMPDSDLRHEIVSSYRMDDPGLAPYGPGAGIQSLVEMADAAMVVGNPADLAADCRMMNTIATLLMIPIVALRGHRCHDEGGWRGERRRPSPSI
jgi:hypothetical protein